VRDTLKDGSREWVTLLAAICADGGVLPPGLIYQSKSCELRPDWVAHIEPGKHDVFVTVPQLHQDGAITTLVWHGWSRYLTLYTAKSTLWERLSTPRRGWARQSPDKRLH
jgi:hypothetical protein